MSRERLSDLGEFGLIDRIKAAFSDSLPEGWIGIGDDCAILKNLKTIAISTDLMAENIHFRRDWISARQLGHRALAVNLSDLAAKGARPAGFFLSVSLPAHCEVSWLDDFFSGMAALSKSSGCPLLGGDTTGSEKSITISITVVGEAGTRVPLRSGAKVSDVIWVSGALGDSSAGLEILLNCAAGGGTCKLSHTEGVLAALHLEPQPELLAGPWLAARDEIHAMMDLSDGLVSDLAHICRQSGVGAEVILEKIPVSPELKDWCEQEELDAYEMAATGGEDYKLLGTCDGAHFEHVAAVFEAKFGRKIYNIGAICEGNPHAPRFLSKGQPLSLRPAFSHF